MLERGRRLWISGLGGLVAGVACHLAFPPSDLLVKQADPIPGASAKDLKTQVFKPARTTDSLRKAATADAGECEAIVLAIMESADPSRAAEMEVVLRRWMSIEGPGKLEKRLDALNGGAFWKQWTQPFFNAWVATDYHQAMTPSPDTAKFAYVRAVAAVEHRDTAFADLLKTATNPPDSRTGTLDLALRALGRNHPDLARSVATSNLPQRRKLEVMATVAGGWAESDPAAALAWVRGMTLTPAEAGPLLETVFSEWRKSDPLAALTALKTIGLDSPLMADGSDNLAQQLKVLSEPPTGSGEILKAIARDPFIDVAGLYKVLEGARVDWEKRNFSFPAIDHDGWYPPDPASAAREAEKLPPGKIRDFLFKTIVAMWSAHDLEAARTFARQHGIDSPFLIEPPSPELRAAALADPETTFSELLTPDAGLSEVKRRHLGDLVMEWAQTDPRAASEWLIAEIEAKEGMLAALKDNVLFGNTLGFHWAKQDAIGATTWMEAMPDGPVKTAAWNAMSYDTSSYSPDLAFEISARVLDGETRVPRLERELLKIKETIGEPAALAHLDTAALSDSEIEALEAAIRRGKSNPSPKP